MLGLRPCEAAHRGTIVWRVARAAEMTSTPAEVAARCGLSYAPSDEQAGVVSAPVDRPLVVVAGAGSGKTETMAARVAWLVANQLVAPEAVLGLTFTRKAASELNARVRLRLASLAEHPDTPPELRLQLTREGVGAIDAVLFTHDHADHTHGIDDLRAFSAATGRAVPAYASPETAAGLMRKFPYIFDDALKPLPGTYKPEGHLEVLEPGVAREIAGVPVTPFYVPHGVVRVFGYRIGPLGYVTDAKVLPDDAVEVLRGVRVLVLNALFHRPHPTHLSIGEAVEAARRVGAARTYLIHLTHHTSHASLEADLPPEVRPAYDGLTVEV